MRGDKSTRFTMRLSDEDREILRHCARFHGLSLAAALKKMLREEARATGWKAREAES